MRGYEIGGAIIPIHLDDEPFKVGDNRRLYVRSSYKHDGLVEIQFDCDVRVTVEAKALIRLIENVSR